MKSLTPAVRAALVMATSVLLACVIVISDAIPTILRIIVPTVVAGIVGWLIGKTSEKNAVGSKASADQCAAELSAATTAHAELRHDLRGMLSPALLNADRLSTNTDPAARRAAEAMIVSIERMEQRLRAK